MRTISQRELRNDTAEIMRSVEDGETFTVTRRGVPVARLTPITQSEDLPLARPAKRHVKYADQPRIQTDTPTADILADLRAHR